jgi:trans-aconitate 2-methyltransferase
LNSERKYQWDAADYAQHSSEQFKWACELTEKLHLRGHETVLDIGCGDGKVTAAIAAQLPNGRVVGIDSSSQMIELAVQRQAKTGRPQLMFELLDVRDMEYAEWFDVAFSNAVLHWIKEHLQMLHRVRKALKKGGRLLFQMGGKGNAREITRILDELMATTKWSIFFSDFTFPYGFYGVDEYQRWLAEAGLKTRRVELIPKDMQHKGKDGFAGWIRSTWLPYLSRIPAQMKAEFIEAILDAYLVRHPPDEEGLVHVDMVRLEVEAVKP